MKKILFILGLAVLLSLTACNTPNDFPVCGDGVCDGLELRSKTCPSDCIPANCAKLGESGPNPSLGPDDPNIEVICCEGLGETAPKNAFDDACMMGEGYGTVCLACGDGMCDEQYENHCNCPDDCVETSPEEPVCGDNVCEELETVCSSSNSGCMQYDDSGKCTQYVQTDDCGPYYCPSDCDLEEKPMCGNGICEEGEADDCPVCETEPCPLRPCTLGSCPDDCSEEENSEEIMCDPSLKGPQIACTMEYAPVCGYWTAEDGSTESKTFSNGCVGCSAEKVEYYIDGAC